MNNIAQMLGFAENLLKQDERVTNPTFEAYYIVSEVAGIKRLELTLHRNKEVGTADRNRIKQAVFDRMKGKPLQYIFSQAELMGLPFEVGPEVLIPRVETEFLIERVISDIELSQNTEENSSEALSVLDIGTGSGVIAVCLKARLPWLKVSACDVCEDALRTAAKNAVFNKVSINFFVSDLFENVTAEYDIIISNPPYISEEEYQQLPDEIVFYEPVRALKASEEGTYFYRSILESSASYLKPAGKIYFEIGSKQALKVKKIAEQLGFRITNIDKDYNNLDRVLTIERA